MSPYKNKSHLTLSILDQFLNFPDIAEVICPQCKRDVMQWYYEAAQDIEAGRCPVCDCENGDDDGEGCFEYCHECQDHHCERYQAYLAQVAYEDYIDKEINRMIEAKYATIS